MKKEKKSEIECRACGRKFVLTKMGLTNISSLGLNHWNSKIGTAAHTPSGMAYKCEIPVPMNPSSFTTGSLASSSRRTEWWKDADVGAKALQK